MSQDNSNAYHTKEQLDVVRFLTACELEDIDAIKKMIFEENFEYNNATEKYLTSCATEKLNIVKKLFEQRELNKELNENLPINHTEDKRPKI